jgi:3-deoxy-manno-octulosonate cytidylyltransferase (CMP-KDO synthetase)
MKFVGVIPARYGSTRFPAKPLALLQNKPLIQWVIEGARQSQLLSAVIVATDHEDIRQAAVAAGATVVMTDSDLPTGTDRIYAATKNIECDVIVNIQGDEPLITGLLIDKLAAEFQKNNTLEMATLAHPISIEELESVNAVKVVLDQNDCALYFSRYPIPYSRVTGRQAVNGLTACLKHVGMYAYSKKFLQKFCESSPAEIEIAESLEQLRALHLGAKIKVLRVPTASPGVDTPQDLAKLEKIMREK